jgi:hypothetical protein
MIFKVTIQTYYLALLAYVRQEGFSSMQVEVNLLLR